MKYFVHRQDERIFRARFGLDRVFEIGISQTRSPRAVTSDGNGGGGGRSTGLPGVFVVAVISTAVVVGVCTAGICTAGIDAELGAATAATVLGISTASSVEERAVKS